MHNCLILLESFESKLRKQYFLNKKSTTFSQVAGQESRKLQRDRWRSLNSELELSSSILQTSLHRKRKQSWLLQQSVMLTSESWFL